MTLANGSLRAGWAAALLLSISLSAAAQRPATISLLPGLVELRSIQYTPDTPADLSQPAAGSCEMAILIKGTALTKPGVTFTNLLTDASGKFIGISLTGNQPITYDLPGGCTLKIPQGQTSFVAPDKLSFAGKGTLTMPFRGSAGDPIVAEVSGLEGTVSSNDGSLKLKGLQFQDLVMSEGIVLPGIQIQTESADFAMAWTGSEPAKWTLAFPRSNVNLAFPELPSEPDYPIRTVVSDLKLDQDGKVECSEVDIQANVKLELPEVAGFEVTLKGGRVRIRDSKPTFSGFTADVQLPRSLASNRNGAPVKLPDVALNFENGLAVDFQRPFSCILQEIEVDVERAVLDLSETRAPAGSSGVVAVPSWKGLWITKAQVKLPLGAQSPKVQATDLIVDGGGLSGTVALTLQNLSLDGFRMGTGTGALELARNQVKRGEFSGKFQVPTIGDVDARVGFSADGKYRVEAKAAKIDFREVGLTLTKVSGSLDQGGLVLGGEMGFDASFVNGLAGQGMPAQLGQIKFGVTGLKIDSQGAMSLPQEGWVTFADPLEIDFTAFSAEVRRVGFTASGNKITSVEFSGGARLPNAIEGLPIAGELDFEGFSIGSENNVPSFRLGGIGIKAEIPQVGSIAGTLHRKTLAGFGDTLYGGADLKLDALGDMAGGIGLDFLIAPSKSAWFVGGSVETPPILVSIPATPAPIPIFTLNGFSGGFGFNVGPSPQLAGRITNPETELIYSQNSVLLQAGVLLADPVVAAPGRIWWADTALTLALNPVVVDLTARMAFLDLEGARYIDLDEWEELDRIARASITIDTRTSSFSIRADAEFFFPTRSISLLEVGGEAQLKIAPNEKFLRIGWRPAGQKPVAVRFARIAEEFAEIKAEMGLELLFDTPANRPMTVSGKMTLDAIVSIDLPGASLEGLLGGSLTLTDIGQRQFAANGRMSLSGTADFGFFTAYGEASLAADFNSQRLLLTGDLVGRAGPFEGEVPVRLNLQTKS